MFFLIVSDGMLTALAFSTASRRRGLSFTSPPPWRAATMISRITRVQILPRFSSWRPLRCWMLAHLECPAMKAPGIGGVGLGRRGAGPCPIVVKGGLANRLQFYG